MALEYGDKFRKKERKTNLATEVAFANPDLANQNKTQLYIPPGAAKPIKYRTHARNMAESYQGNTARVKISYDVDWDRRWEFCYWFLGHSEIHYDVREVPYLKRFLPHGYLGSTKDTFEGDHDDQRPWLWAVAVETIEGISPRGVDKNGAPLFEEARVTLIYESLSYRLLTDDQMVAKDQVHPSAADIPYEGKRLARYVTRFVQPSAEYFALPHGRFFWVDGAYPKGPVTGSQLGYIVPSQEIVYIWHQVPRRRNPLDSASPPAYAAPKVVKKMLGAVNRYDFDKFEKGTLLLTSVEIKPYRWIGGAYYADITYKMKYLNAVRPATGEHYDPPRGHNYFLQMPVSPVGNKDDGTGFFQYEHHLITHNGQLPQYPATSTSGITLYREYDFAELFIPDA